MICLDPPYRVINGYTVLGDHADPSLFYVIPAAPDLALTREGLPSFSLVQYLGGGAGDARVAGGLLTMTTELHVEDEALEEIRARLEDALGGSRGGGEIRLQPVVFDRGSVDLIALGNMSSLTGEGKGEGERGGAASGAPQSAGPLEVHTLGSGRPSLSGRNTAAFQLVLGALEAELIERCLEEAALPIVVLYRVSLPVLRPSFQVRVEADWHKVYTSLQNKVGFNVYVAATDAEAAVNKALEESDVRIVTEVYGTGEGARGAAERARKQLTEWVLERLFEPMVDPAQQSAGVGRIVEDTVWSLVRAIVPGVSYKLRVMHEDQVRNLSARMNESVAERFELIVQGTVGTLLQRFRLDSRGRPNPQWPSVVDELVHKVNLDGFPRLEVKVGVEDRFESDGLREVVVELARPAGGGIVGRPGADRGTEERLVDRKSFSFRSAREEAHYVVNLLGEETLSFGELYRYRFDVRFDPTGPFGAHDSVSSEWKTAQTAELYVEPRELYTVKRIDIGVAPTFSFDQFPHVTVELRDPTAPDGKRQNGRVTLNRQQPVGVWQFRSFAPEPIPVEYRVTYHRTHAEGGNITGPWRLHYDDWLNVPDPMPVKRTLNLFVNLPWPQVVVAFVQIRYRDDANGVRFDEQIDLDASTRYLRRDYPIAAGGPQTLSYRLTMLMTDGRLLEGSWRETEDERLIIDSGAVEKRVVTVRTLGGDLASNRLSEVSVTLQVREPGSDSVRDETELRFTAASGSSQVWEYLVGDPPQRTVHYRARFIDANGFVTTTPWSSTQSNMIVVDVRNQRLTA